MIVQYTYNVTYNFIQRRTNMVHIKGARGEHAHKINGLYEPSLKKSHHASVYVKNADEDMRIVYVSGVWYVQSKKHRNMADGWAKAEQQGITDVAVPLEECPIEWWRVDVSDRWIQLESFSVSRSSREQYLEFKHSEREQVCILGHLYIEHT